MAVSLDSLRKAVKKNKGRSQAMAWLADMERASGDYEAALKTVDAALAASPSDVPAMLVRAKILAGQQDFAGSITEYKKVLAKDPFCLSAHKRMGESYDKLGKEAERNACFRRVHDMDPLDPFWKDEYDVLTEEEQASLVAPPMDDSSFTMDVSDDTENADAGEDNIFANLAASLPNTDEEDNSSMEALRNSLNFASDEIAKGGDEVQDASFDGHALNSSEVSSAISDILGGDDDLDVVDSPKNNESAAEESSSSSLFSHFSDDEEKLDVVEEPKSEDIVEEKSDDVEFSLDSLDEPLDADEKTTNVDDAFSSLLGDDELPEETPAAETVAEDPGTPDEEPTEQDNLVGLPSEGSVPATHMDFSDEEDAGKPDLLDLDETPAAEESKSESNETNVDDAFASLLGEDELPEENDSASTTTDAEIATEEVAEPVVETPAEETALDDSADLSLEEPAAENAEADAPVAEEIEEKPLDESKEESFGSLFEKSADAEFSLNDEAPADAEESVETKPAEETEEKPLEESVEESFGSLFEKSADADFSLNDEPAADVVEKAPEFTPTESAENVAPVEGLVPTSHMDFSDEEDLLKEGDEFVLNLDEETPAFDALFGDDEAPTEESSAEETVAEEPVAEQPKEENLAEEMGGAFASMFGDEKPVEESPAEESLSQEATSAVLEEKAVNEDVEKSVDESFDSIFGSDADDLPEEKSEAAEVPAEVAAEEPTSVFSAPADTLEEPASEQLEEPAAEPAEQVAEEVAPSAELDSIDSEVSNAFKGLFDEDDSLPESDEPNNNGVDYLMSGDSDDEVAASLVENADAPLSRGAADLDDSLNTRTLADIYMEQGVYDKALDIYTDLAKKNPDNEEIKSRLEEVKKLYRDKFGEV